MRIRSSDPLNISVHITGDGSLRTDLERLTQEHRLNDYVTFRGYVTGDQLYRAYAEAEIFCGFSRSEALGNVFLEAQAAGCAVIATNVGGIPEIVKDGATGILIEPDNPEIAAEAIERLLKDENRRTTLAAAAIEHAKAYDWGAIAEKYAALY